MGADYIVLRITIEIRVNYAIEHPELDGSGSSLDHHLFCNLLPRAARFCSPS